MKVRKSIALAVVCSLLVSIQGPAVAHAANLGRSGAPINNWSHAPGVRVSVSAVSRRLDVRVPGTSARFLAPNVAQQPVLDPVLQTGVAGQGAVTVSRLMQNAPLQEVRRLGVDDARVGNSLDRVYDLSAGRSQAFEVIGTISQIPSQLQVRQESRRINPGRAVETDARRSRKQGPASGIMGIAVVAAVVGLLIAFRKQIARALGIGKAKADKKLDELETPEVLAQKLKAELKAKMDEYNQAVNAANVATETQRELVKVKQAEVDGKNAEIDAVINNGSLPEEAMKKAVEGPLNVVKELEAELEMMKQQLALAEAKTLEIEKARNDYAIEYQAKKAKIGSKLTESQWADIEKGFADMTKIGDTSSIDEQMKELEEKVARKKGEAAGSTKANESNPDKIFKDAARDAKRPNIDEEIAKRKKGGPASAVAWKPSKLAYGLLAGALVTGVIVYFALPGVTQTVLGMVIGSIGGYEAGKNVVRRLIARAQAKQGPAAKQPGRLEKVADWIATGFYVSGIGGAVGLILGGLVGVLLLGWLGTLGGVAATILVSGVANYFLKPKAEAPVAPAPAPEAEKTDDKTEETTETK